VQNGPGNGSHLNGNRRATIIACAQAVARAQLLAIRCCARDVLTLLDRKPIARLVIARTGK
jgi:hypothetical protein